MYCIFGKMSERQLRLFGLSESKYSILFYLKHHSWNNIQLYIQLDIVPVYPEVLYLPTGLLLANKMINLLVGAATQWREKAVIIYD